MLFKNSTDIQPFQTIKFDPQKNCTFHFWHIYVEKLKPVFYYAFRVKGPGETSKTGNRFNEKKILIDPYSKGLTRELFKAKNAADDTDNLAASMRSVAIDTSSYDWGNDKPLNTPIEKTIIYEVHLASFTKSSSSGCKYPGTFSALAEKIPYLKNLGITALELMPVFEFDDSFKFKTPDKAKPLKDFWGYNTIGFFAPHSSYCVSPHEGTHIREFRDMIKALHQAGIEIILDVVFSHTGEGNQEGPTISFKGFDNNIYYLLSPEDKQYYLDYSGCGNTLNCNHPIVQKYILDCLKYWVGEMHVDGFRFDEASILSRGEDGKPMPRPPVIWQIELSEKLSQTKIIAEAWDAAGLYQVGYFPGYRFGEWNGQFRDETRRFVRGEKGLCGAIASRIGGSADIYESTGRRPVNSVNFITSHDGFTLNDLVSYRQKHNELNGEENRDGLDENFSANYGAEGETQDETIIELRERQIKNFAVLLLISKGIPMILYGDEMKRTQKGNNNAYCQDNEISWFDWNLVERNKNTFRFFKEMIIFRKRHFSLSGKHFFSDKINKRGLKNISWFSNNLKAPVFDDPQAQLFSFVAGAKDNEEDIFVMINMSESEAAFKIPEIKMRDWYWAVNTAAAPPFDIAEKGREGKFEGESCLVKERSIIILVSK